MESWVVGAIADPSTARVHRAPVVQGAKGVDGGAVMMVGDYPA
jgi:phosphoribosylformylglycinamidine cyclo-ligase